jgi:hypothetical protein
LCFEMAARQIIRTGERYKSKLLVLPERQDRVAQCRMEAPIAVESDRLEPWLPCIRTGPWDRRVGREW